MDEPIYKSLQSGFLKRGISYLKRRKMVLKPSSTRLLKKSVPSG